MSVSIHLVTPHNAHLLANVESEIFDEEIQQDHLIAYLADARHAMFIAVEDGLVVGQVRGNVHLQPDRASDLYIDNLGTAPSHQRRGIASALMDSMLDWGKRQGCTYAWVATETDNYGAKGFYAARRFAHDTIAMFAMEMD